MTNTQSLLIELHTEELPPKALFAMSQSFGHSIGEKLAEYGLLNQAFNIKNEEQCKLFATPRRLAVQIHNVSLNAQDKHIENKLMPASVGLINNSQPSAALIKKLHNLGLHEDTPIIIKQENQQDYVYVSYLSVGKKLHDELSTILEYAIHKMPIPKLMSYQLKNGHTVNFARPVHSLMCLYGYDIIPATLLGLNSGRTTQGHRFLNQKYNESITLSDANTYEETMHKNYVVADYIHRKNSISTQLIQYAKKLNAQAIIPDDLLNEVTALVEYPYVYCGEFDAQFLHVPEECLILTMQTNQKYFALRDLDSNKLKNCFLFVSNMKIDNPENIIQGNQRVVRARLSDAEFFFNEDKKQSLGQRSNSLSQIIYHNKLGSQAERLERMRSIIDIICEHDITFKAYHTLALRACDLCKNDLTTNMVAEFPELQGVMGSYYATHDGEDPQVVKAIKEHYLPKFAGDYLPNTPVSCLLALADKLETLVGIWHIDLKPNGEKDPYALRRHALGILRIIIQNNYNFNLQAILKDVQKLFRYCNTIDHSADIYSFCMDRLANFLKDKYSNKSIDAVIARLDGSVQHITLKLNAVQSLLDNPNTDIQSLLSSYKRIDNILKKQDYIDNTSCHYSIDLLQENVEIHLHQVLISIQENVAINNKQHKFLYILDDLLKLSQPLDAFFKDVMVNTENIQIKQNRLYLLKKIHKMFNLFADLTMLS